MSFNERFLRKPSKGTILKIALLAIYFVVLITLTAVGAPPTGSGPGGH